MKKVLLSALLLSSMCVLLVGCKKSEKVEEVSENPEVVTTTVEGVPTVFVSDEENKSGEVNEAGWIVCMQPMTDVEESANANNEDAKKVLELSKSDEYTASYYLAVYMDENNKPTIHAFIVADANNKQFVYYKYEDGTSAVGPETDIDKIIDGETPEMILPEVPEPEGIDEADSEETTNTSEKNIEK